MGGEEEVKESTTVYSDPIIIACSFQVGESVAKNLLCCTNVVFTKPPMIVTSDFYRLRGYRDRAIYIYRYKLKSNFWDEWEYLHHNFIEIVPEYK